MDAAYRCEQNCTNSSGKPTKIEVKKVETTGKSGGQTKKETRKEALSKFCNRCNKPGNDDSNCWFNSNNQRNANNKEGEKTVGIGEVFVPPQRGSTQCPPTQGYQKPSTPRARPNSQSRYSDRLEVCYFCDGFGHRRWNCPKKKQWEEFLASMEKKTRNPDDHMGNVEIEALEEPEDLVNVADMTRAQQQKAGLSPIGDEGKEPEPRKTNNEEDWKEKERLRNSMIEAIQQKELEEHEATEKARGNSTTTDDVGTERELLDNDWARFPDYDVLNDTTKSTLREDDQSVKTRSNEDDAKQLGRSIG